MLENNQFHSFLLRRRATDCDTNCDKSSNGVSSSWDRAGTSYQILTIMFYVFLASAIVKGVLECIRRRAQRRRDKKMQEAVNDRDKFVKEKLPTSKWREEKNNSEDDANAECAICMEPFVPGAEVSRSISWNKRKEKNKKKKDASCQHLYHTSCIKEWLLKHHECPICRNTFLGSKESNLFILHAAAPATGNNRSRPSSSLRTTANRNHSRPRRTWNETLAAMINPQSQYAREHNAVNGNTATNPLPSVPYSGGSQESGDTINDDTPTESSDNAETEEEYYNAWNTLYVIHLKPEDCF